MPPRRKTVTARDVAVASGVSQATVSYVVNNDLRQRISPETRDRVLSTIAKLGYVPNESARALRLGRSNTALLVFADVEFSHGIDRLVSSLTRQLGEIGINLVLHRVTELSSVRSVCRAISPSIVMSLGELDETECKDIQELGIDVAIIRLRGADSEGKEEVAQQENMGKLQVEYLFERGHRALGYAFPQSEHLHHFAVPRRDGALARAAELGLAVPDVQQLALDLDDAAQCVKHWMEAGISAVAAYNDDIALALLGGMSLLGFKVPADLAIIGVDAAPFGAVSVPPLTTIEIDTESIAAEFVRHFTTHTQSEKRGVLHDQSEGLKGSVIERASV